MKDINVGIVGTQFMGKAHSNAYKRVNEFFDLPFKVNLQAACGRNQENANLLAQKFGWKSTENDWRTLVQRDDIDIIDICTSNQLHAPIANAAAKNGKHILCEKPMAMSVEEARQMLDIANDAGVSHMIVFNYRFVPAIQLAKRLIDEGEIGEIHHFNAVYYQDWLVDPKFPIVWRHDASVSGSGAHGDMSTHTIDLARYLLGEFEAVCGDKKTFIKERPLEDGTGKGTVTTDDAISFMARFRSGAVGNFISTRFANGRKNFLRLEIFGSKGSLSFNLERLNELQYFSGKDEEFEQGFKTILVTEKSHPYIDLWWPPGHTIGWEHTFIHQVATLVNGIGGKNIILPDFNDGLQCQIVLDAVIQSANDMEWKEIPL